MEREKHLHITDVWDKIQSLKKDIEELEAVNRDYSSFFFGKNGKGVLLSGERKTMFYQMAKSFLQDDLEKLEKEYESL